ncbi:MAG: cation transporter [Deltaproteobacteria bacterium]|nr:cation transporter [Deltaproteobacteria bacterium]
MSSSKKDIRCVGSTDRTLKKRLIVAVCLTAIIFFAELVGGIVTNSLALLTDAAHVFMDMLALSLSLFAIYISALPPSNKRTYGLHRVEVLVAFINGVTILLLSVFIAYKGILRVFDPPPVEGAGMLAVAVVGLIVNAVVALWLMKYAKSDLNVRSAFLHVIGDALASVGVIIAAIIIFSTGYFIADPIISIIISVILFYGASRIVRDSTHILLEGVPKDIDLTEVVSEITNHKGVRGVHSIHIWSICHKTHALSAHVDLEDFERPRPGCILKEIDEKLAEKFHILYTTLQVECSICDKNGLLRNITHDVDVHSH